MSGLRHSCELWKLVPVITFSGCYFSIRLQCDVLIQDRESRVDLISLKSKLEQLGQRRWSVKLTHAKCVSLAQDGGKHFREIWRFLKLHSRIFNMENTKKKQKQKQKQINLKFSLNTELTETTFSIGVMGHSAARHPFRCFPLGHHTMQI